MKPLLLSIGLFALFAFFGCSSNPYRPFKNDVGYSETKFSPKKYQVMFHGSDDVDELEAKDLAILRASEIARKENFDYIRIDTTQTKDKPVQKTYVTGDPYYYNYGPYGWYHGPYYGYSGYGGYCGAVTRTSMYPVVSLTFTLESEACPDCISVDQTLQHAAAAGIIEPSRDKG